MWLIRLCASITIIQMGFSFPSFFLTNTILYIQLHTHRTQIKRHRIIMKSTFSSLSKQSFYEMFLLIDFHFQFGLRTARELGFVLPCRTQSSRGALCNCQQIPVLHHSRFLPSWRITKFQTLIKSSSCGDIEPLHTNFALASC